MLTISRVGFGGMPLSIEGRPSEEQGRRVLHAAIDAGMTFNFRESIGVAKECARRNITFLAYSPVGGGRLAKKLPAFKVLQDVGRAHDASVHAVTIAWVRAQAETVVPIPGARTVEHAVDSAHAAELVLTAEELRAIDGTIFDRA